jgi:hypothetical protein
MMYRFNGWMKEKVNHHTFEKKKAVVQWMPTSTDSRNILGQRTLWRDQRNEEVADKGSSLS